MFRKRYFEIECDSEIDGFYLFDEKGVSDVTKAIQVAEDESEVSETRG